MMLGVAKSIGPYMASGQARARLIFQPAEEKHPGGAQKMIRDGVLEGVERVTGLHLQAESPSGRIGARQGSQSANSDRFIIRVRGRGGHGSAPHSTIDPIVVTGQIIGAVQTIVSRMVNPIDSAVITIGSVHSGSAFNAIPSTAELRGTVRTFRAEVQDLMETRLTQVVNSTAAAFGAEAEIEYMRGYPSVVNTEREWQIFRAAVDEAAGPGAWMDVAPKMGGEDFSYYLHQRPGVFWNLGAQADDHPYPHHHEQFTFDESVMPLGVWMMIQTILAFATQP